MDLLNIPRQQPRNAALRAWSISRNVRSGSTWFERPLLAQSGPSDHWV